MCPGSPFRCMRCPHYEPPVHRFLSMYSLHVICLRSRMTADSLSSATCSPSPSPSQFQSLSSPGFIPFSQSPKGMMDAGYFVGRKEIVDWVNETLQLSLTKVEQTASGAVACQLLDRIYPGKVPLNKVNWEAKLDYEFLGNYKVLQNAFTKLKIDKILPVEKLVRAKYQDNLEFMQWFKRFYELNNPALDYDPVAARAGGKGAGGAARVAPAAGSSFSNSTRVGGTPSKPLAGRATSRSIGSSSGSSGSSSSSGSGARDKENSGRATSSSIGSKAAAGRAAPAPVVDEVLVQKAEALRQENATLQATIEGLEKERDFYFEKLTVVEEMLQERQAAAGDNVPPEVAELVESIFKVLYATESTTAPPPPPASVASVDSPEAPAAAVAAPTAVV